MKRLLYVTSFLMFWVVLNFTMGWAQTAVGPKMVVKEKSFDAQQVKEGEIIVHNFKVLNTGDSPLEIKKVNPG